MIISGKASGYTKRDGGILVYVSPWMKELKKDFPMRFLDPDIIPFIAEINFDPDTNDIFVVIFPHNAGKGIVEIATKREGELLNLILESRKNSKTPPKKIPPKDFVFDFKNFKILDLSDFKRFYPKEKSRNCFIFYGEDGPVVYVMDAIGERAEENIHIPSVIAASSQVSFSTSNAKQTLLGKSLFYSLVVSRYAGKFVPKAPHLDSVSFPTSGTTHVPRHIKTQNLEEIFYKSGANKLVVTKDGVEDEGDDDGVSAVQSVENFIKSLDAEDSLPITSTEDALSLSQRMIRQIVDKSSVNLTDMLGLGIEETIESVPMDYDIVSVELDIQGIAKKMCVFEKRLHVILKEGEEYQGFDILFDAGAGDLINFHSEETFPKSSPKLLPPPSSNERSDIIQ